MLLIPTFLAISSIKGAGVGLFAGRAILKDEAIWRFDERVDRLLTTTAIEALPELTRHFVYRYACRIRHDFWLLCCDNDRFVNHDENPNMINPNLLEDLASTGIAARDIAKGEEITEDYSRSSDDFREHGFSSGSP